MAAVVPKYREGPVTFDVAATVTGGMIVDATPTGVQPAAATSAAFVGIATTDGIPAGTPQTPTVPGAPVAINAAPIPPYVAVANRGVWPVTYAVAATFGQRLITAANGQVQPAGATPAAGTVVGVCYDEAGVAAGAVGSVLLSFV